MSYSSVPTGIRDILSERFSLLPLKFCIDCWGTDKIMTNETFDDSLPQLTLQIHHPGVIRTLILSQDPLVLAEAYLRGFLDFTGNIDDLMLLEALSFSQCDRSKAIKAWMEALSLPQLPLSQPEKSPWQKLIAHSRDRDLAVVQYHYDVGNDFYRLWLDPLLVYSCAYFEHPQMSLQEAQQAKLDLICRKLQLKPDEYLLDIGCGWGALLRWAVTHYGVKGYGITLSKEQLAFNQQAIAKEGLDTQLKVELLDYRNLPQTPTFDKIVSVGMVEHVGIKNYPIYFQSAFSTLKPEGLFLNHGITASEKWDGSSLNERFVQRYIFPDGELSRLSDSLAVAEERGWEIVDVDAWRMHYAKTMRCWAANLDAVMEKAIALSSERKVRLWRLYLIGFALAFEQNHMGLYQVLLRRRADKAWKLPFTRKDWLY
ncbi:class I SAM-dependent methyltransferase [Coleofasciculus sp. FACHB-SPT9]|uniref:class I SAM-dependent methyltransferase n=1 Tax=Cyanophyceae TaxID=3028117 RepID=UPI001689B745|nr:class I SAM-dependent methyltransferase [Coleofasciculus sp. FACHB-SPT9]MBD1891250.1 class I SAM-dependent methyltransferase [Coleofasciculus sp. FACHB-SPT9]